MEETKDKFRVLVSEGILQDGTFGAYLVSEENPSLEYRLKGGCRSPDEAKMRAKNVLEENPYLKQSVSNADLIEVQERSPTEIDSTLRILTEEDLEESIRSHLELSLAKMKQGVPRKEILEDVVSSPLRAVITILKRILTLHGAIFLLTCCAIWLYWTKGSVAVPEELDLPFVGDRLGGTIVNAPMLARYFPVVILALYVGVFLRMLRTNLQYDLIRKHILALVFLHGWRALDFAQIIQKTMVKSGLGWFVHALDCMYEKDPASLANLRKLSVASNGRTDAEKLRVKDVTGEYKQPVLDDVRAELNQELEQWLPTEFERRIHSIYFMDRESDYNRFVICFDPLIYVVSLNRVIFWVYEFLRHKGIEVDPYNAPRDPYLIERVAAPVFWFGEAFRIALLGSTIVWSFLVAGHQLNTFFAANVLSAVPVLLVPSWWNYLAMIKKRGFPKTEPLGAYTVGPIAVNRLSIM